MNIEELKRLAEAATPGPWEVKDALSGTIYANDISVAASIRHSPKMNTLSQSQKESNAQYIAAANPAAVLELIAEVEYLRGKNREHFDACMGCDEELKRVTNQRDELMAVAKQAVDRIAYAIYNLADKKLEELPAGIIDSTDPVYSGLIAEKFLRAAIAKAES